MKYHTCMVLGTTFAALAVVMGAFGAHALETRLPQWYSDPSVAQKMAATWEVAVRYQMYHAVGLILLGVWGEQRTDRTMRTPALAFCVGIVLFSGLLYALVLTGIRIFGAIVPLGGTAFIVGWLLWSVQVYREGRFSNSAGHSVT